MILYVVEVLVGILLIASILLQMQGSGLSTAFGGAGEFYRSKRSVERLLMWATGFLTAIFAVVSIFLLLHR